MSKVTVVSAIIGRAQKRLHHSFREPGQIHSIWIRDGGGLELYERRLEL